MNTDTTRTNTTRTYTLQLTDGELYIMTWAIEHLLNDAETGYDMLLAKRTQRLMALLNKLEDIEPVEVAPAKADWPFERIVGELGVEGSDDADDESAPDADEDDGVMNWDHRVVRDKDGLLSFAEMYYEDGKPSFYSSAFMCGDTLEELQELLGYLTRATEKPVIDEADLNGGNDA